MMKARKGRIITIASVVGVMGNAGQTNYAAAKAGIIGFSKSWRAKWVRAASRQRDCPRICDTDMTAQLSEEQQQRLIQQVPVGRLGTTSDIAQAVKFLASPHASYITGETLHINGGMYMI